MAQSREGEGTDRIEPLEPGDEFETRGDSRCYTGLEKVKCRSSCGFELEINACLRILKISPVLLGPLNPKS